MNEEITYHIEDTNKVNIIFKNTKPVNLTEFAVSMIDLANNFQDYVSKEIKDCNLKGTLYIKEIRKGSIDIDLIAQAPMILATAHEYGILLEWVKWIKDVIDQLAGNKDETKISKKTQTQIENILQPVANDEASQLIVNMQQNNNSPVNIFVLSGQDANTVIQQSRNLTDDKTDIEIEKHKQVFRWNQVNFENKSKKGTKGIIESITKKPLNVFFETDATKEEMTTNNSDFDKAWQDLAYVVDVEVHTINGKPASYKIIRYYPDDTFDPNE